jgi:UDP-N-acetylmuramoyl-L-alanyl-D-glutamate--2,6-diaminopimelate ligase
MKKDHLTKTAREIFSDLPMKVLSGVIPEIRITDIVADSRLVIPGAIFVAVTGGLTDGHQYIQGAITKGAAVIVGEQNINDLKVPYIQVENTRQALAYLSAAYYDHPARNLTMIGVTGTDGKTTTCNLIHQILLEAGIKTGMITTVNAVIGDEVLDTGFHVTTPDAPDVQRYLAKMVEKGLTHVILEATSHGLAQYRVDACEFDIGVVTNITHEHLDYHGSYKAYRDAKARLFLSLDETHAKPQGNPRLAVLNRDDTSYKYLKDVTNVKQICYGLEEGAEVRAEEIIHDRPGFRFIVKSPWFRVGIISNLSGNHNILNILAAIATTVPGLGINPEAAAIGIKSLSSITGRMERIDMGQDFTTIVDFAHTPNALRVTLEAARKIVKGRVIVIFGSAGLRDREKRRMMAEISAKLADLTIITAEDPRTESLEEILKEMSAGARAEGGIEGKTYWRIPDRGDAIRFAVSMAQQGDIILACGKGHEKSMCFGTTEYTWDDRLAMRAALAEYLGVQGPEMPYLPTQEKK